MSNEKERARQDLCRAVSACVATGYLPEESEVIYVKVLHNDGWRTLRSVVRVEFKGTQDITDDIPMEEGDV